LDAGFGIVGRQPVVRSPARLGDALSQYKSVVGKKRLEKALLLLMRADGSDQVTPLPALTEGFRNSAVAAREFRHHQGLGDEIEAMPAPLLRHRKRAEAEPGAFLEQVPIKGLARIGDAIACEGHRADLFDREFAGLHLPGALLVGKCEVHARSSR